jgi:hypothetical protein
MTEDNIQGLDGYVSLTGNNNVRTLGLQNFYGHVFNYLHNVMVRSASKVWIKKDFIHADTWPTYSDAVPNGWEVLAISLPGTANREYFSELSWNSAEPWALYPSKLGGNSVEPIGDAFSHKVNNPFSVVCVGGNAWYGENNGTLNWRSDILISSYSKYAGGRSLEIIL